MTSLGAGIDALGCAADLRGLAAESPYWLRADDLRSLADDVDGTSEVESWSNVDLLSSFDRGEWVDIGPGRGTRAVAAASIVSVFLPVAWTYYGLREASAVYATMSRETRVSSPTFLSLWITGFYGRLAEIHRLVPVATVSLVLIVLAAGLALASRAMQNVAARKEMLAVSRLIETLGRAQRILRSRIVSDPSNIEFVVKSAVKELQAAQSETRAILQELRSGAELAHSSLSKMLDSTTAAVEYSSERVRAAENSSATLSSAISDAQASISRSVELFGREVAGPVERLSGEITAMVGKLTEATERVGSKLDDSVAKVGHSTSQLSSVFGKVDDVLSSNHRELTLTLSKVARLVEEAGEAYRLHDSSLQAQISELTMVRDAAERLLVYLEASVNNIADPNVHQ